MAQNWRRFFSLAYRLVIFAGGLALFIAVAAGFNTAVQQKYLDWSPYLFWEQIAQSAHFGLILAGLLAAVILAQVCFLRIFLKPLRMTVAVISGWMVSLGLIAILPPILRKAVRSTPTAKLPLFAESPEAMQAFVGKIIRGVLLPERALETLISYPYLLLPFVFVPLVLGIVSYHILRWPLKNYYQDENPRRVHVLFWLAWTILIPVTAFMPRYFADSKRMPAPETPNIVLISVDTLRADVMGAYGAQVSATPNLDKLAARGVRFSSMRATSSWTLPSHASLFTGRWPWRLGVRRVADALPDDAVTLAEALAAGGYDTHAVVTHLFVDIPYGMGQGFAEVEHPLSERSSEAVLAAYKWMDRRNNRRPFFLFLHLYDPHWPYMPQGDTPTKLLGDATLSDRLRVQDETNFFDLIRLLRNGPPDYTRAALALYLGEVADVDRYTARLLEYIAGLDRPTVIALVSDHGELFGEHSMYGHGVTLYESEIRIPWIVTGPGISPKVIAEPASLIDVAPTLLGLVGLADLMPAVDGLNLSSSLIGDQSPPPMRWVAGENEFLASTPVRYFANNKWKWFSGASLNIRSMALLHTPFFTAIDLDPLERQNILGDASRPQIAPIVDDLFAGEGRSEHQVVLGEDDLIKLRALGYLQ